MTTSRKNTRLWVERFATRLFFLHTTGFSRKEIRRDVKFSDHRVRHVRSRLRRRRRRRRRRSLRPKREDGVRGSHSSARIVELSSAALRSGRRAVGAARRMGTRSRRSHASRRSRRGIFRRRSQGRSRSQRLDERIDGVRRAAASIGLALASSRHDAIEGIRVDGEDRCRL